jgi:hypothetical protein
MSSSSALHAADHAEAVKVIVRCRPMTEKEISENYERFLLEVYCFNYIDLL